LKCKIPLRFCGENDFLRFRLPEIPPPQLVGALRSYNLLPAIVFLTTRRRCDEAASEVALFAKRAANDERQEQRRQFVRDFITEFPEIKFHKHRNLIIRGGVASHHAGHLPAWKLLVEKLMSAGLLDAIFATSTVAAGVDFPARTVVISQADTRSSDGWRPLQASELQQMTGRAGRRGRDNVGFIVLAPGTYQNPARIAQLLKSKPDDLISQFRATYSSLLNLLDAYGNFAQVRQIAERSFAFRETARKIARLERKKAEREKFILQKIGESGFKIGLNEARAMERLASARMRLQENLPEARHEIRHRWLLENVQAGRIVTHGRGAKRFFLVLQKHGEKIVAMRDDGQGATFQLNRVHKIYAKKYPLEEKSLEQSFFDIQEGRNPAIAEPTPPTKDDFETDAADLINQLMESLPPAGLSKAQRVGCMQTLWEFFDDADFLEKCDRDIESLRGEIWQPFEQKARVLDFFGYLDFATQKVTDAGKWLADVRVDRPLLFGEALKNGFFTRYDLPLVVALVAALAADGDRNYGELALEDDILEMLGEFEKLAFDIAAQEFRFGVEPQPEMNFSAAATAALWADEDIAWEDFVRETAASEGDLVRLLSRTGEALRQIAGLKKNNPAAAEIAARAAEIVLREPIR
jgi:ATP-dependent RNA helicase HelY